MRKKINHFINQIVSWVKINNFQLIIITLFGLIISVPCLLQMTSFNSSSDTLAHMKILINSLAKQELPIYSLYYFLIWAGSFFSISLLRLRFSSFLILLIAKMATLFLTYYFFDRHINKSNNSFGRKNLIFFLTIGLFVAMPILDIFDPLRIYLLHLSPNIWHNSTIILAMPFVILSYNLALNFFQKDTQKNALLLSIAIFLCTFCKPNFTLAFLPVFFITHLVINNKKIFQNIKTCAASFLKYIIIALPTLLLLLSQYIVMFMSERTFNGNIANISIVFTFFSVWSHYTPNIIYSILRSLILPLSVFILNFKILIGNLRFGLISLVFLFAFCQTAFLGESNNGILDLSGNFFWGSHMALYLLIMETLIFICNQPKLKFKKFYFVLFGLSFISGLVYVIKIAIGMNYH